MSETKFTPGPWRFSNGELSRVFAGSLVVCGVHKLGKLGGLVVGDPVANGALISAAPDLYEALEAMKSAALYQCGSRSDEAPEKLRDYADKLFFEALDKANAALAKASPPPKQNEGDA